MGDISFIDIEGKNTYPLQRRRSSAFLSDIIIIIIMEVFNVSVIQIRSDQMSMDVVI